MRGRALPWRCRGGAGASPPWQTQAGEGPQPKAPPPWLDGAAVTATFADAEGEVPPAFVHVTV